MPHRAAVLLALAAALAAGEAPLPEAGPVHAAVVHALTGLARGETADLLALPDAAFADPPALPDPVRPGVVRRWTLLLPREQLAAVRARLTERIAALRPGLAGDLAGADPLPAAPAWPDPVLPGVPSPLPEPPELAPAVLRLVDGHLVAAAPGAPPAWQTALAPGDRAWLDGDCALIADASGLDWIARDGVRSRLPPFPADVVVLGIDGGSAFFAQDRRGWRLPLRPGAAPSAGDLGLEPLDAPLAGPGASLWLGMTELALWDGARVVRVRHGLPVGRGWRLARDHAGTALVLAPDGRTWTLPPLATGTAADDERLGRFAALDRRGDLDRGQRFRAALRHRDWAAARSLAADAVDRAALALYAGDPPPPGASELAPLPQDPGELALAEPAWSGGVAPRARAEPMPAADPGRDRAHPLADAGEPWPEAEAVARTSDGLAVGARTWLVADDGIRAEATCRDDGTLRWFARWLPEPGLGAPGRTLALCDSHLVVGEGDARLLAFAAATGAPELDVRPRRVPVLPGRTWLRLRPDGVAGAIVLYPPGIDDRLGWLGEGGERSERLPGQARWLLALPDGERWLALADGSALACDDHGPAPGAWQPIRLPAALVASVEAPHLVEGGVAAGGTRWRWRR